MKKFFFLMLPLLLSALSFAAFDNGHFNYGRQWAGSLTASDVSNKGLSHIAIWLGDNDKYNEYWEGAMMGVCKQANLTPVIYAYVIAEYDKDQGHTDCDMGNPNHCTNGAETIRKSWGNIIARYKSYAEGIAKDYGTSNPTVWLIEPDFIQYSRSGDSIDTRFSQVGGGIPDDSLAGYYFNSIVSTIKTALPNAKIAVDISPWLNDFIRVWYSKFDKSKVDYLFTSGGRTQGDNARIRGDNNNNLTWSGARSAMGGKPIIADDGYGVGGQSNGDYIEWLNINNLSARVQDGVIGLTIPEPADTLYKFAKRYNISITVQSSSSSTQSSSSMSSSSMSSSSSKVRTVFELTSGNVPQTVTAGDEISPIVYRYENLTKVSAAVLSGLSGTRDSDKKTYTISGRIPEGASDGQYEMQLTVTGPDTNFVVKPVINVKHKPVVTSVEVTSNATQTVTAGDSIKPIVFKYANIKNYSVSKPSGFVVDVDQSAQEITVRGLLDDNLNDQELTVKVDVTGLDNSASASAKITVKHKPAMIAYEVVGGNADRTVTAGEVIEPIVYSYKNVRNFKLSGIPKGLNGVLNQDAKTYTISGTVPDSLTDYEYTYTISMTGIDNDSTATGKITVKHRPALPVFELTSGNADQTVTAGNEIEPIVFKIQNVTEVKASGLPAGLTGVINKSYTTYTIWGTVADSLTAYVYDYRIAVTGVDGNTSAAGKITVVERSSSSVASSSSEKSSSSEESSSSSLESSSSEESSSSVESSSSETPSSSSVVTPPLSSSSASVSSSSAVESSSSEVPPSSSSEIPSSSSVDVSSNSEESSSSEQSSSSEEPVSSSSVEESSSSDANQIVVTGSLNQTVAAGGTFETITFSNVQSFNRDTWNIWFFDFKRSGDVVTVEGSVHVGFPVGKAVETVTVNGQKYEITFVVTAPESSSSVASSSSSAPSSSSVVTPPPSSSSASVSSSSAVESSSSVSPTLVMSRASSPLSMVVAGRTLHVSGANDISVEVFDMQGRPLMAIAHVKGAVNLESLHQGNVVIRLRTGSSTLVRRIVVK